MSKRIEGFSPTDRTTLRRFPKRGNYQREVVEAILDEGLTCHLGFVVDEQPYVIPTTHARCGDRLYVHGAAAGRMLRTLKEGAPVCVTVTLLDGLVLARSAFHHSMNYRSVVVLGVATEVAEAGEKKAALEAIVEHVLPGRAAQVRPPSESELKSTTVLSIPLREVSAKIRTGPPLDDESDYGWPCWAGEIPLRLAASPPVADPRLDPRTVVPGYAKDYQRPNASRSPEDRNKS
ncbi:MAG TPA: pyridoxamine 5'-phosphate oxidase family protein [Myxococcaceae bacterium]|nr:pyridoxamine 5'-phosphate oxidase family protein [Myxococcaceae bacterium]